MISKLKQKSEVVCFGPFRLIASKRLLMNNNEPLALRGRTLDVLIALVERAGEVVTRRELIEYVWPDVTVEEANLRMHVAGLRKALGDGRDGVRYIANIPGRGYSFVAAVQRLTEEGLSTSVSAALAKTRTLPARLQRMIGRDEAIEALRSLVTSQRFVSIVGPGGMGKTTLAVAVAHMMVADFDDAIFFMDLGALNDGALIVPALASAVGCLGQMQDSLPKLVRFLAEKRILLILDSCEHVVEAVAALAERLFRDTPLVHLVATTREALRVQGEYIYLLQPLKTPPSEARLSIAEALAFPAVQLFMDRAAAGGYLHDLANEDMRVVASICRQLDGIPLAIELTASQASTYGVRGLSDLIGDRFALFWQGRRGAPRHQTLRAALDWSYNLLSVHEKMVLCRLSIFVGAFTLEAAQAVADEPDSDAWHVGDMIASLVDKSLVSVSSDDDQNSYRLLDTTRAYAAVKLAGRGEENAIARRHAFYCAERLAEIRTNFPQDQDLSAYSRHIGDVRAALQWCFSPSGDAMVGVAVGIRAVLLFLGLSMLCECRHWCQKTIMALEEADRGTTRELTLQVSLAMSSMFGRGDSGEVNNALERGIALAETLRDAEQLPHLLAGLNLFRMRLGDFAGALAAAERYAAAANEFGGRREKVVAEWMLGGSHHLIGNQADAQQHYERGFGGAIAAGVARTHYFGFDHELWARIGLARTLWLRGFPDQAAQFAHRGIEFARGHVHPVTVCICLIYGVEVFLWRGDEQVAAELIDQLIGRRNARCRPGRSVLPLRASRLLSGKL
jgi:predicted ATPase/DNA-binding winged helix-turn-helix (wHTH) protein